MRGSSHEALGLAAAYTALASPWTEGMLDGSIDTHMDTAALPLAAMCLGVLILWEAVADAVQKPALKRLEEWEDEQRARGLTDEQIETLKKKGKSPKVRWHGPRRLAFPLRLLAYLAALTVAVPIAVATMVSRLPDKLEVGPWRFRVLWVERWTIKIPGIDHRTVTHWLITAAALIVGMSWLLQDYRYGAAITTGLAIGYLGHLIADGLTLSGVPYLWPVWREDLHLLPQPLRVRMGSLVDTLLAFGALAAMVLSLAPHGTAPALAERHVCKHRHKHPVTHTHKRCHHAREHR